MSVLEEDTSIGDTPLKAIDADETVFKNVLSLRRSAIRGLNVAKYYPPSPSEGSSQASCRTGFTQQMTHRSFGRSARASG